MLTRRVLRLFDLLVGLVLVVEVVGLVKLSSEADARLLLAAAGCLLLAVVAWVGWRTTGRRWWPLVFTLATFGHLLLSAAGTPAVLIVICLGVALVTLDRGTGAGLACVGAMALCIAAATWVVGNGLLSGLLEGIGTAIIFGLGVAMGQVLRALSQERELNARLLDEVRRSARIEQELVLAEERARSARELHDGLGHQLTLVVMGLDYAERMRDRDPAAACEEVSRARQTAVEALAHMRRWVRALNPPRTEGPTGAESFDALADSFRGTGLDVVVRHAGEPRALDRDSSLFAIRMVQEGLTNVLRHSRADRVELDVGWLPGRLHVELRDNGGDVGLELTGGFGLRSLTERASEVGGWFTATGTSQGVALVAEVPTVPVEREEQP